MQDDRKKVSNDISFLPIAGFTRNSTDNVLIEIEGAGETASGYHIRKSC